MVKNCTFPRSSASFLLRSLACGALEGGLEWSLFGSGGGLWVASLWTATEKFEGIGIHFGHVAFNGVAVFPLACTKFALNVEFSAFAHIFLHDFGLFAPNHDIMPLCALSWAVGGGVAFRRGKRERSHALPLLWVTNIRVFAHVTKKNYFVY